MQGFLTLAAYGHFGYGAFVGPGDCGPTWGREKSSETIPVTQLFLPGQVAGSGQLGLGSERAWRIPTFIHRDVSRLYSALLRRFGCNSDIKGLCAACSFLGLDC